MPDTKITNGNNLGFWVHEIYMQLAYCYIYDELIKPQYSIINKDDMLYSIKFHIDGYSTGIMSLGWENYTNSQSDKQMIILVLQSVKTNLQNKGAIITITELQAIPTQDDHFKTYYRDPFPTYQLIKIVDALIEIIQGDWTSTNYSMDIEYK
ncbi:hypothetical protein GKZ90_0017165 [Flavobacterium sp. MC2016-06]|jgi:hypothetical protein|uniref:hypothetical protein n=1 Tax=Flavobacterium sp. MC2016-06 TaxID=2676308 RepID=UPI0012BAA14D|nr:hypothetical protein [Flavobacterium sp. MC2016-06]MBU3862009.1 hypothetical protein [Flavobacterium sp. MC2016-06]